MPHRILVVSNFFPPHTIGGAEIVAFRQARALAARGHQLVVLAGVEPSNAAPPGWLSFDLYEGLPVYRLSLRSLSPDLNFYWPAAARRLKAIVAAHGVEVVHFHNAMGLGANLIPAAKNAVRHCVMTLHDHWGFCFRNTRLRDNGAICENHEECAGCLAKVHPSEQLELPMRLRRDYVAWCVNQANRLLVPSAYLAYAYTQAGFCSGRMTVISNGIDLDAIPSAPKASCPDEAVKFLWSGYIGEHKGIFVLLDALTQLAQDQHLASRWQLTIAGEGHLRPKLETELKAHNLTRNVRYVGRLPRSALLNLLRASDVSVLTSVWPENEPVTMLEAIASGTAQIATRIGGNVALVEHMQSGFLVMPGDPAELAGAMRRYILDPTLVTQHGARNRERRTEFDERRTIDKLEEILAPPRDAEAPTASCEPLVICGTGIPPQQVATLIEHLHDHLLPGITPRFIWHEWAAESAVWNDAALVWFWDRHCSHSLFNTALRRGVPVLAPITDWAEGLGRHYGGVILYRTYLEALATLRNLLSIPNLRAEFFWRARAGSAASTSLAPASAFTLRSEAAL
jgi:glycosyltransferase involved in cell wall biosynthesis